MLRWRKFHANKIFFISEATLVTILHNLVCDLGVLSQLALKIPKDSSLHNTTAILGVSLAAEYYENAHNV